MKKSSFLGLITIVISLLIPSIAYSLDSISNGENEEVPLYTSIENESPDSKKVLIINSYYDPSPVPVNVLKPILERVAHDPKLSCEIFNLNSQLITDSLVFYRIRDNLFRNYHGKAPDYIIMAGKMAFNLRTDIKEHWGDIPILLIAQTDRYAPLNYYFAGVNYPDNEDQAEPLANLRKEYNFTAVTWPTQYTQTVDMIMKMRPDTRTLIFASDESFLSRNTSADIYDYLLDEYPGVGFRWLHANKQNAVEFQKLMAVDDPTTTILLSSWSYGIISEKGFPLVNSTELKLISAARSPIFTFNESMLNYGAVGGVFIDRDALSEEINDAFSRMLAGESMRSVPFYINPTGFETVLNYPLVEQYGLSTSGLSDVRFIDRPPQFWDKYHWEVIGVLLAILIVSFLLWKRMNRQQNKIKILNRHQQFITNMPVAFCKVSIKYDADGNVANISTSMMNQTFKDIIAANKPEGQDHIFTDDFINEKIKEINKLSESSRFTAQFAATGEYYDFLASFLPSSIKNGRVQELDFFAIDQTEHMLYENKIKNLTRQLDTVINVAGIIPWYWFLKTDELKFDAYNIFSREELKFTEDADSQGVNVEDAGTEYFTLIHPDDTKIIRELREDLYNKSKKDFRARYRLRHVVDGKEGYHWVEIRGRVVKYDRLKNPEIVAGAMWRLDDEDVSQTIAYIY